ncbi:MAG: MBL fold metallo-hydrolase [Actinomycetota bacterium]
MIDVLTFRTEGLGDSTYLVTFQGLAVLVDPQRDIERFLAALDSSEPRWVLETHLHNDYVSGGLAAARRTGAELVMPAAAAPAFAHTPAFHMEDLVEGDLAVRPIHTPGHTPEHTSYLILVDGNPQAVFSGGSLLVGSAGRSDLLGPERAETLARLQFGSVRRLAALPGETGLYPTHGAGSFCTVSEAGEATSTIARERRDNPALTAPDADDFVGTHLAGLQPYPRYYARMAPINLRGPAPMPQDPAPRSDPSALDPTSTVVDIRPASSYAAGHLPGSVNIPLSEQFGTWFGWLIPADAEAHLVAENEAEVDEALLQLRRIGIDQVAGVVLPDGDVSGVESRTALVSEIPADGQILDVRSPAEREQLAPEGTLYRYLPDLLDGPPPEMDQAEPVWVICASGYRSAIAASLLRHQGIDAIPVLDGSVADLVQQPV